jgi:predicted ATPase
LNLDNIYIKIISIENLYGFYTYDFNVSDLNDPTLLILYGNNGSGKTTILNCIYYLLNHNDKQGYKSNLSKIKFSSVSVSLSNGITVRAYREGRNLLGTYIFEVLNGNNILYRVPLIGDSKNDSVSTENMLMEEAYLNLLDYIKSLEISLFFLPDNRKLLNVLTNLDVFIDGGNESFDLGLLNLNQLIDRENSILRQTLNQLNQWIKLEFFKGTKEGEFTTNEIYNEILKNIPTGKHVDIDEKEKLVVQLNKLTKNIKDFAKYGLLEEFEEIKIDEIIVRITEKNDDILIPIMKPYVESLSAKLESLKDIYNVIEVFINNVNFYYSDKTISFNINKGFEIIHSSKEILPPSVLSSGEKHLLLLFCNSLLSKNRNGIFIIDEPEISLNVEWQRTLINTLSLFQQFSNQQFLIASHSIEIVSPFSNNILHLKNLNA